MRHLIKHFALWDIVLIVGVAAIVMLIAARVDPTPVNDRHADLAKPTLHENAVAKHSRDSKSAVHKGLKWPQDDYYDRRRRYWEDRLERRLDEEEGLDDEDKADSTDKKDSKATEGDDDEDSLDQEEELIERRREYWRQRLEREW